MPRRYLIEHDTGCGCPDRAPARCETAHDVAVYLWGRRVSAHVVWQGECPYRVFETDIRLIEALLHDCPVEAVRPFLPCTFFAGGHPLVMIGTAEECRWTQFRAMSYMTWLRQHQEEAVCPDAP